MVMTALSSPQTHTQTRSARWLSALAAALAGRPAGVASAAQRGARPVWRPF